VTAICTRARLSTTFRTTGCAFAREATTEHRFLLGATSTASDERLMADLGAAAEKAMELLSALDTTTAGPLANDADLSPIEVAEK
jgi:hypothetical protein